MGSDLSDIAQCWSMARTELDLRFQKFLLHPRFQIFQPVSVAIFCFCPSLQNYHWNITVIRNIPDFFRVSGLGQSSGSQGPAYRGPSEDRPMRNQHLEPLANEVWKLSLNFAFPWCRTKQIKKWIKGSAWNLRVKV